MDENAADREKRKQPKPERKTVIEPESVLTAAIIPPHYALEDFSQYVGKRILTQRKGDIIRDQQTLNSYKQQNAPIAPFDEAQMAKCPNPKCGCVFAWDGSSKREA